MSERQTAFGRVRFNEFGDYLDKPYVVRALFSFDVNRLDDDGCLIDNEVFHVAEGSLWEIYRPSYTGNDVHLDGDDGYLELNWDDLKLFKLLEEGGYYDDDAQAERLRGEGE